MGNKHQDNPELTLAHGFLQTTAENVFLTGKAGTGKTTFLHNLRKSSPKRMVVLAPTGVAAINAGGVTIHSFFQMPFGPWIPGGRAETVAGDSFKKGLSAKFHRFSREKLNIIRSVDLIVIDEISMVRADLLDGIDEILRRFRDRGKPFGGVQLLMIGDIQQLAPVIKDDEWELLKEFYETPFFFGSKALKASNYITIELKNVYRQSDPEFIGLLNRVRHADGDPDTFTQINKRYVPGMDMEAEGCIILTTHNYQAKKINEERMNRLKGASATFSARIEGEFPEYSYPTDPELEIKSGAQVMFVKNDSSPEKRYFNGKIGKVTSIDDEIIYVKCSDDGTTVAVGLESWQNARYGLSEAGEIVETVIGSFTQYPLKAAWAITIHKSQGLTFDKVIIDASAAFAHGQVYVALSRCRTLEGLFLTSKLSPRVLIKNASVSDFSEKVQRNQPGKEQLQRAAVSYQHSLLYELFDFSRIKNQSGYLLRNLYQNKEILLPEVLECFQAIDATITSRMVEIAGKFSVQIGNLLLENPEIESNPKLQDRVKKAAVYFMELLQSCAGQMSDIENKLDFDNKEIRKMITMSFQRFQGDVAAKLACMEACREGFSLKAYLEARSKGSMEKPAAKKAKPARPDRSEMSTDDAISADIALLGKLKAWRSGKAREEDVPEFMILHQRTMMQIASILPSSSEALKAIKGMGKRKVNRFGEEILRVISDYCAENNKQFSYTFEPLGENDAEAGKEKVDTRKVTFDLLGSGMSPSEIASERKLTLSTIEGHIAHYIGNGELDIDRFLASDKVSKIREYFLAQGKRALSPAKSHFGEEFTYGELGMVLAHMDHEQKEREK
jgi:DNA-directed RNA polymerase subunit F